MEERLCSPNGIVRQRITSGELERRDRSLSVSATVGMDEAELEMGGIEERALLDRLLVEAYRLIDPVPLRRVLRTFP